MPACRTIALICTLLACLFAPRLPAVEHRDPDTDPARHPPMFFTLRAGFHPRQSGPLSLHLHGTHLETGADTGAMSVDAQIRFLYCTSVVDPFPDKSRIPQTLAWYGDLRQTSLLGPERAGRNVDLGWTSLTFGLALIHVPVWYPFGLFIQGAGLEISGDHIAATGAGLDRTLDGVRLNLHNSLELTLPLSHNMAGLELATRLDFTAGFGTTTVRTYRTAEASLRILLQLPLFSEHTQRVYGVIGVGGGLAARRLATAGSVGNNGTRFDQVDWFSPTLRAEFNF